MNFIDFLPDKCDECFKCLRVCPTKAIAFAPNNRHIVDDLCIKCGLCLIKCKQEALTIHQDIQRVKFAIKSGKRVIASIAPSFAGLFIMNDPGQMANVLKILGFYAFEETAVGAEIVSKHYENIISASTKKNIITSCCPSSNYLIEHYYKNAIDSVIPVVSPMIAHGRDIKQRYGDVYTVFIGPCVAKKAEANEIKDAIDAVITFRELENWINEEEIVLSELESIEFTLPTTKRGKAYPLGGSLWKNDMETRISSKYKYIHIDGIDSCIQFLDAIEKNEIEGYCAELNICSGSCVNGPEIPLEAPGLFKRISILSKYVDKSDTKTSKSEVCSNKISVLTDRVFTDKSFNMVNPDESEVANVLMNMGKYTELDQINCGACGYNSCYEKAVAVTKGYSDIEICLERLKQKAVSTQSIIFDNSPNCICILDEDQRIKEVNYSFNERFNKDKTKLDGWPISSVIGDDLFEEIKQSERTRISKKHYIKSVDKTFYFNIMKIEDLKLYVGIFTDITEVENSREELMRVKERTLETCQKVIDNQMRVAQEIASLLGETTAETKIGLNKLKKIVLNNGG